MGDERSGFNNVNSRGGVIVGDVDGPELRLPVPQSQIPFASGEMGARLSGHLRVFDDEGMGELRGVRACFVV